MGAVSKLTLAIAVTLAMQPAWAQSPGSTLPPGAQNPALQQPQLIAPPPPPSPLMQPPQQTNVQPATGLPPQTTVQPGAAPTSPSALIIPGGAGGLCECLINHDPGVPPLDKTHMHQACLASVDACQSACNSQHFYSFVPHATYTCPGPPNGQPGGHIALNTRPLLHRLAAR